MPYQPTTTEYKAAYLRSDLWRLGWSFDDALACYTTRVALRCSAIAARRAYEKQQGKPAPIQPALDLGAV